MILAIFSFADDFQKYISKNGVPHGFILGPTYIFICIPWI